MYQTLLKLKIKNLTSSFPQGCKNTSILLSAIKGHMRPNIIRLFISQINQVSVAPKMYH